MKRALVAGVLALLVVSSPSRADDRPIQKPNYKTESTTRIVQRWIDEVVPAAPAPIDAPGRDQGGGRDEGSGRPGERQPGGNAGSGSNADGSGNSSSGNSSSGNSSSGNSSSGNSSSSGSTGGGGGDEGREARTHSATAVIGGIKDQIKQFIPLIDKHKNTFIHFGFNTDAARRDAEAQGRKFHQLGIPGTKIKLPISYSRIIGCFTGDAVVATERGPATLASLYLEGEPWGRGRASVNRLEVGVVGPDGLARRTLAATRRRFTGELVTLDLAGAPAIRATPDHLILARRGDRDVFVRADALETGDELVLRSERSARARVTRATRVAFDGNVYNLVIEDGSGFLVGGVAVRGLDRSWLPE